MPVFETITDLRQHRQISQRVRDLVRIAEAADHVEQLLLTRESILSDLDAAIDFLDGPEDVIAHQQ